MRPARRIWLSETAAEAIVAAAGEYHPVEIGGVLVGVAVGRQAWITEAVVIPSKKQTPTYYELPAGARHAVVDTARARDGRIGYIGDWHVHPVDIGPSRTDHATMQALSRDQSADCPRPILLIARRVGRNYCLDARQFVGRRLRELQVIATGALPSAEASLAGGQRHGRCGG